MILVLFLTVGGLALAVQSFGRYDTLLLEQSDSQLYGLARSVDRSVSGALEQFIGELDYLIRLENFTDAEADCLAGQPEELLQLLQNNPLIREALITDFLCLQDGRVLLSASGRTGYTFPVGGQPGRAGPCPPCVAENGTVYLSFQLEGRGLWYAALVDLSLFYRQVAGGLTTSPGIKSSFWTRAARSCSARPVRRYVWSWRRTVSPGSLAWAFCSSARGRARREPASMRRRATPPAWR